MSLPAPPAATSPDRALGMTRRRRLLIAVGVLAVAAVATTTAPRLRPRALVLVGVVDANEVVVTPPVQARLDSLWIEEGTEVRAGQPIASLERDELAAQAAAAGASTASARAQLDQAAATARQ